MKIDVSGSGRMGNGGVNKALQFVFSRTNSILFLFCFRNQRYVLVTHDKQNSFFHSPFFAREPSYDNTTENWVHPLVAPAFSAYLYVDNSFRVFFLLFHFWQFLCPVALSFSCWISKCGRNSPSLLLPFKGGQRGKDNLIRLSQFNLCVS